MAETVLAFNSFLDYQDEDGSGGEDTPAAVLKQLTH
jgi:hypothetical protein